MVISSREIDQPVQFLKGVGPKRAACFAKMGVHTVGDLLLHFPARYEDLSNIKKIAEIEQNKVEIIKGSVKSAGVRFTGRGRKRLFEVAFADETGILRATWFKFPQKAFTERFKLESEWLVSGKVILNRFRGSRGMVHPHTEHVDDDGVDSLNAGRVTAIYPLTEGLTQKAVRVVVDAAMVYMDELVDFCPEKLNEKYRLPPLAQSIKTVHWPDSAEDIEGLLACETREQKKLIFNEFFLVQVGLALKRKKETEPAIGAAFNVDKILIDKIAALFPFQFTNAQKKVISEIAKDVATDSPMNRLLQGDVGSGKTAVALAALLMAIHNKRQAVIMAPTEILALQHMKNISNYLAETKVTVELLTAGIPAAEKKSALDRIAEGEAHIIVGTHALIQEGVTFARLGLAIIDEQHRFGVRQRAQLISRGKHVHTLIMTATPIPRTLAMTIYGDLNVSVIDELPPGRTPITTKTYFPNQMVQALEIVKAEVALGRQAYIIYPLVDQSEKVELKAAVTMFKQLQSEELAELKLGLIHGRMKSEEKESAMTRFISGDIDVLVSTTVVEVGVDCPNASVIMIEHAERFGLLQLHQLRGRVGRGSARSYCLLITEGAPNSPGWARAKVMTQFTDGFSVAEEDLKLRGAGDFFGSKQSGLPEFKIGDIIRDHKILAEARKAAFKLVDDDPTLSKPAHAPLKKAIKDHWAERFALGEIG